MLRSLPSEALLTSLLTLLACGEPEQQAPLGDLPEPTGDFVPSAVLSGDITFNYTPVAEDGPDACAFTRHIDGVALLGLEHLLGQEKLKMGFWGRATITDETRPCYDSWFPPAYENGWPADWRR